MHLSTSFLLFLYGTITGKEAIMTNMKTLKTYLVLGILAASFLVGAPSVFAQQVSAATLLAQINSLLILFQDLQAQLATLKAEQSATQSSTSSTAPAPSSFAIFSPNGGESFVSGQPLTISWSGGDKKVQIGLIDSTYETNRTVLGWISLNEKPNSSLVWDGEKISDITGTVSKTVASVSLGPYKIIAVSAGLTENYCVVQNSGCNYDASNSYFSLVSSFASGILRVSCMPSVGTFQADALVTWEATALSGRPPYVYSWSGTDGVAALPPRPLSGGKFLDVIYKAAGIKTAGITARDAAGKEVFASCAFPVTITPAPSPLTLLSPNGGESFVLTRISDPSQFVKVSWRLNKMLGLREEKIKIAIQDALGRECVLASAPRTRGEAFIGLVDGFVCPQGHWALSPGQYKIKVYLEGKEAIASDESDYSFTLTPPVLDIQSSIPLASVINSGESVKFRFVAPPHTLRASLYFSCSSSISANPPNACNKHNDVTSYLSSSTEYTIAFSNSSSQSQNVAANFYVYLPNNPNHGRGVPAQITVHPVSAAGSNSITVLSPNGGETVYYGQSTVYRFTSNNQTGLVDLTLVPYPPIDAGLVCQIASGVSASAGTFTLAIPTTYSCLKGPSKVSAGSYTLFATLRSGETKLATDSSDAPFTISASSTVPQ